MNIKTRLAKLERNKRTLVYPSFSDMYETSTRKRYITKMLELNPGVTADDIAALDIKHINDMYKD